MSNLPALPDMKSLPAYLKKDPAAAAALLDEFLSGLTQGLSHPTIRCKGTRFIFKKPGEDDVMHDALTLATVILKGRQGITKKWFATKYVEGQEPTAPDCFSNDGVRPDPSCKLKQCDNCASCPQNVFGSGTNAQGEPGKGKACADAKNLAVYVNKKGIFDLALMPTALSPWQQYVKTLGSHGLTPSDAITVIGFDATKSFPCYTFEFGGLIPEAQYGAVQAMVGSPEVKEICTLGTQAALPAEQKALTEGPSEAEKKAAEKKAADAKKAAEKKAADEKKAAEKKAAEEAAAAANPGVDLGLGDPAPANTDTGTGFDAIINALGLDLD